MFSLILIGARWSARGCEVLLQKNTVRLKRKGARERSAYDFLHEPRDGTVGLVAIDERDERKLLAILSRHFDAVRKYAEGALLSPPPRVSAS